MSDYMFMLENHLNADQNRVVADVQAAAGLANMNVFLAGGAMRDVLGGFQVRDLDFSVEGNALKIVKHLAERAGVHVESLDENRKSAEMVFPGGVTVQIAMSRFEKHGRAAARPQVSQATIQEDLRGRDFTVNAIALSLNRASLGLLLDPTNGLADLERRELRAASPYCFYDDPLRIFRLWRLRVRLGFGVEERTAMQYSNARSAEVQKQIPPRTLFEELKRIAEEPSPGDLVRVLEEEELLAVFSPLLAGPKLNLGALGRLDKTMRMVLDGSSAPVERLGPFLDALTEKLTAREKSAFAKGLEIHRNEVDAWQKLEQRAKKLELALRSARVRRPSQVYEIVSRADGDAIVYVLYHSSCKPVQERIRNYYQKYLPALQEIPPAELEPENVKPGTARYDKARQQMVARALDRPARRPRPVPEQVTLEAAGARARSR